MLVAANSVAVIGGTIDFPLTGTWTADLRLDQPDGSGFAPGTSVTVTAEGGYSVKGTVPTGRTGDFLDAVHVRLVGGAGGLGMLAAAQAFAQPGVFVRDVVNALMAASGETLSPTADQTFLGTSLGGWFITPRPVGQCIQTLVDVVNRQQNAAYNWRVLADGTVWFGQESWPSASGTFDILRQRPEDAAWDLGVESPFVMPGTTLDTVGQVGRVEHYVSKNRIRQRVWQYIAGEDRGWVGAVRSIVKQQTASVDYLGLYEATVISQSADGATLDVQPIDTRFAGSQRLESRWGIPGVSCQVVPGSTVIMGFKSGDPSQAFVHSWKNGASLLSVTFTDKTGDSITLANGQVTVKVANATWISGSPASMTLGTNPAATPILTIGAFDSMGVPVTNSPTNTGTVLAG